MPLSIMETMLAAKQHNLKIVRCDRRLAALDRTCLVLNIEEILECV